ncbi:cysteine and histidine-rich domain-containing protein 1 [Hyalella azteca]|uniref:Cysteine and histidine-rich domain-containing protein 1 n=1 Tax=Hyalella azteca TaxID=294128 RepID=A0A8B7NBS8_HYAAZ|nr:cysteine and histidine-rich domain-containing protein 1 [Hyalella azteca]
MTEQMALCYNKGCGQKFNLDENSKDACIHHPGEPIFHDADKSWSCCKKRSKDFTEFLSMPGCTAGPHNPVKPVEAPKCEAPVNLPPPTSIQKPEPKERPSFDAEMTLLRPTISASLKQVLQKNAENEGGNEVVETDSETGIRIGETCKRNGCKATYEGRGSSLELCTYHPGGPVFHEGMKYWGCCRRKTTDFTEFLAQPGCCTDQHLWKIDQSTSRRSDCRYDWHQTSSHVYVTIYAKNVEPAYTTISVNSVRLSAYIRYSKNLVFQLDTELEGTIDPAQSSVTLAATKVEIKLRKDEARTWAKLQLEKRPPPAAAADESKPDEGNEELADDIDAVDLSDL